MEDMDRNNIEDQMKPSKPFGKLHNEDEEVKIDIPQLNKGNENQEAKAGVENQEELPEIKEDLAPTNQESQTSLANEEKEAVSKDGALLSSYVVVNNDQYEPRVKEIPVQKTIYIDDEFEQTQKESLVGILNQLPD